MTDKDNLAAIAIEIEALSAELLKVNNYIDILGKPAIDKANEIDKALKNAKDLFATALADEQVEARIQRLSRFSDIRVEVKPGDNLLSTSFTIKYMKDTWDMAAKASSPKQHECVGFAALDDDAYDYLITQKPHAIPAAIMALAPGKPADAMALYFLAKQRDTSGKGLAALMPDPHDWGTGEAPKPARSFPAATRPRWHVEPRTFDDLLLRAGPYADATKAFVEWGAVQTWLMKDWPNPALASALIPDEAAGVSVLLSRQAIEHEAGWPQLSERAVTPALYDLPQDAQGIARRMAGDIHALWEAAGRPYLDTRRFKDAYRWLVACVRSGSIPPVLTIGHVPPLNS